MAEFAERFKIQKPMETMSENDKRMIHETALEVMETVGVRVHSRNARAALKRSGAIVDDKSPDVRFPRDVVKSLMSKAPQKIVLAGRSKEFDLPMDGTHSYYTTDGCGVSVWDSNTGTRRKSVLEDVRRTALIADYLPYVSIYIPMVVASDLPEHLHVVNGMKVSMENTQKHVFSESTTTVEEAKAQVRMAAEVDYGSCMQCGQCQEKCITGQGIVNTNAYSLSLADVSAPEAFDRVEKEIVVCECCGAVIGCRDHLLWIKERLGAKAYGHPTLLLATQRLLDEVEPSEPKSRLRREDQIKDACAKCRQAVVTLDEFSDMGPKDLQKEAKNGQCPGHPGRERP